LKCKHQCNDEGGSIIGLLLGWHMESFDRSSIRHEATAKPSGKLWRMVAIVQCIYGSKWFILGLIVLGIGLRLQNYLTDFDMFLDEISVASSILPRTYRELWKPLDYYQNAPIGFLIAAKFFTHMFANTAPEHSLRLYALLTAIASVPLFWLLASRVLSVGAVPLAVFLFAVSKYLVGYSSEVKQYEGDATVAVFLLLISMLVYSRKRSVGMLLLYAVIGALGIWFSQPAVFILTGIGLYWSVQTLIGRRIKEFVSVLPVFLFWAANFVAYYVFVGSKYVCNDNYLKYFAKSFMPWPPASYSDLCWFPNILITAVEVPGGFRPQVAVVICFLLVAGFGVLYHRQRHAFFFLLSFVPLALLASGLRLFPLQHRIILFTVPILILGVAEGTTFLTHKLYKPAPCAAVVLVLIVALPPALDVRKYPFKPFSAEGVKQIVEYISQHRQANDTVFLYRGFDRYFKYYAPRFGMSYDMPDMQLVTMPRKPKDLADLRDEIEKLRGYQRVWLLFYNMANTEMVNERTLVLYYLDGLGRQLDAYEQETVSLYLYDLTTEQR
jgi:hypothetical protein